MQMLSHFYLNYISLSSILVVIFMMFLAFFLLQVKNKAESTKWLTLFFVLMVVFYAPYISGALYHPIFAFHRWATVFFVLVAGIALNQFILRFPENTHPRLARTILILQLLVNVSWSVYFCLETWNADKVFKFSGHQWDFAAEELSKTTGIIIFLNMLVGYAFGFWRAIILKKVRWVMLGFTLSYMLATVVPGITNVLSRDGALSRGIHQTVISVAVIVGFFSMTMLYINTTKDRTTFMAKIIGVSFATFMLLMTPISYLTLEDKEAAYNKIFQHETHLLLKGERPHSDFRYRAVLAISDDAPEPKIENKTHEVEVDFSNASFEFQRAYAYAAIQSLAENKGAQSQEGFARLLTEKWSPLKMARLDAYQDLVLQINAHLTDKELALHGSRAVAILQELDRDYRKLLTFYNKTRKIPVGSFRAKAEAKFQKVKEGSIQFPFAKRALRILQESKEEGTNLKSLVLSYLLPMQAPEVRRYRNPKELGRDAFVTFMQADLDKGLVYEIGYSYLAYRAFIHELAFKLFGILILVSLVVLIGFRFFFAGALVSPLNDLLSGVKEVNEGDFSVHVPIRVEDEIGFLARSFNGMVTSIRDAQQKLQDYAENLEEKVEIRTQELKATLDRVQALKNQQDGDYFLTSLLTRPLNANRYKSENIDVEFLLSQKKKFSFKERDNEIGGDLCSAHRIRLKGKDFLVFMNADAMGKSIQGAGGVLVLGSVFESLIMRTMLSVRASNYHPERWLKNAFIELHKVFEAFDGSMLISVVFGLVEEATGFLYYINAEHPYCVSYYKGKARFLDEDVLFRKLGTIGLGQGIHILTHQLRSGEVFLAGSDGRDDILLGETETGERIINQDESLFLEKVEKADADLKKIVELIKEEGELTDDLSLLKITFQTPLVETPPSAPKELQDRIRQARGHAREKNWQAALDALDSVPDDWKTHPAFLKERAGILFKLQRYEDALSLALKYLENISSDEDVIYLTSLVYKRLRDLSSAADYSERVRLRNPKHVENLVNLADIYQGMGEPKRAEKFLRQALEIDPKNRQALRFQELFSKTVEKV